METEENEDVKVDKEEEETEGESEALWNIVSLLNRAPASSWFRFSLWEIPL